MYEMVRVGCPPLSWAVYPVKKSGQLMTHHSGLIHPFDGWDLYPYRRVSSNDLTINKH